MNLLNDTSTLDMILISSSRDICGVPQEKGAMDFLNYQQLPVILSKIYLEITGI